MVKQSPLKLSQVKPFAEGGNRLCFVHPDNAARCVKVTKHGAIEALRARRGFVKNLRKDAYFDDNLNEFNAYQQSAIIKGGARIYDHLPRCYGWCDTDIGKGLVSDYFTDKSENAPAPTLESYLHTYGMTDEIKTKLDALATYLRDTGLMTKNIIPHNVVIAADGKLKIIDGIGYPSAFSITKLSRRAARRYIERRIERMFLRCHWEVSDKSKTWKMVEKAGVQ